MANSVREENTFGLKKKKDENKKGFKWIRKKEEIEKETKATNAT